ncbi:hypothetical protein [Solidesulfovibrio alcoholivorans]|uniref:hypothetical protein n=1 Tax=Solidesulfovibrio alcoholivorans TaxID=81406 RepID=UPI000AE06FB2|nr:hypothetical protein [Solidesulfovibrio alcoholivorans]
MRYVFVLSGVKPYSDTIDIIPSVLRQTKDVLLSLKGMFGKQTKELSKENSKSNAFSITDEEEKKAKIKVTSFSSSVEALVNRYRSHEMRLWIDSGGYSFIKGDIDPECIGVMAYMYHFFVEKSSSDIYRIFTLDLPFNEKFKSYNNKQTIGAANRKITEKTMRFLEAHPSLCEKFIFAMHAKTVDLYDIWLDIYKEYQVGQCIQRRAIGGLVGVRKDTSNVMSPFIVAAYKALIDFLNAKNEDDKKVFSLHFLGINLIQDRFAIAVLEDLFSSYDRLGVSDIDFSYDTSGFGEKARKGNKKLPVFVFGKRIGLYYVPGCEYIDPSSVGHLYDEKTIEIAMSSLKKFNQGERVDATAIFEPINVHSQMEIDKILSRAVKKYDIGAAFFHIHTPRQFEKYVDDFLACISHGGILFPERSSDPDVLIESNLFNNNTFRVCSKKNLLYMYNVHKWFVKSRAPYSAINQKSRQFVRDWAADKDANSHRVKKN